MNMGIINATFSPMVVLPQFGSVWFRGKFP